MALRNWYKLDQIVPILTIIVAFSAPIFDLLNIIQLTLGENLVLLIVGLLAIDALTERISTLEGIRKEIELLKGNQISASRFFYIPDKRKPLKDEVAHAKTIDICGVSLLDISTRHYELLCRKAANGCKIRLILLNPNESELMQVVHILLGLSEADNLIQEIRNSLRTFFSQPIFCNSNFVEIRLYDKPLPHTMLIINGGEQDGSMNVDLYVTYKRGESRPCFTIRRNDASAWYELFWEEFNQIWANSKTYSIQDFKSHKNL